MKIEAKVYKKDYKSIKGTANITIDDCFVVKGILIMESKNGLFIAMPSKKTANGEYKDICFPITKEARQQIIDEIMKKYNAEQTAQNEDFDENFGNDLPF